MAEIHRYGPLRHLRSEANKHVIRYRNGERKQAGQGLAFWFLADGASIAEIPLDDREMPFLFKGRSKDYQEATVQGSITWRVADPAVLGRRIDFSIDLDTGSYQGEPLDQITGLLTGLARQGAAQYLAERTIDALPRAGLAPLQAEIAEGLAGAEALQAMGLEVLAVRVADLSPSAELDRAMQTPTFEALQQKADEAMFQRRALAVEKERAIAENELQNRVELARREAQLIEREQENARNRASGVVESRQIEADGEAARIRVVGLARTDTEKARIDIYRDLPRDVLIGLAAREFAGKLKSIEHLNVTPDMLSTLLGDLAQAGVKRLEANTSPGDR